MKALLASGPIMLLAACAAYPDTPAPAESGLAIAERRCAGCHAVGMADTSPRAGAPPLRDLYKRYPVDALHQAFLNGVHVGHPDMPTFRLSRGEVDALLAYLRSIDPCAQPSSDRAAMQRCFAPL